VKILVAATAAGMLLVAPARADIKKLVEWVPKSG